MNNGNPGRNYAVPDLPQVLRDFVLSNTQNPLVALVGLVIAEINRPALELIGECRREDVIGRSLSEFTTPEAFELMQQRAGLRMAGAQRADSQAYTIIRRDGSKLLIDTSVLPWPENPVFAVAVIRDVTRAQDELRELQARERLYRSLAETIPAGVIMEDALGRVFYANDQMGLLTGYTVDEIRSGVKLIEDPGEGLVQPWSAIKKEISGSDQTVRLVRKDGKKIWVSVSWRPLVDTRGNIQGTVSIFADITRRVQAEEAVRESETVLRTFVNALKHPVSLSDCNGRLLLANETLAQRFGIRAHEAKGVSLWQMLPPDIRRRRREVFREVVETGKDAEFEDEREGRFFRHYLSPVIGSEGNVKSVAWIAIDITERKKIELALKKEEKWSRTLIENIPGTVVRKLINAEPPIIDFVSQAIYQLTGRPDTYFVGKPTTVLSDLIVPEDREAVAAALQEAVEARKLFVIVYRIRRTDGTIAVCRERGQPISDESGNLVYIDSIIFDITDLHRAEQALRESEEKYRTIVENSSDIIALLSTAGEILHINTAAEDLLGYKPEEITRFTPEMVHPEDWTAFSEAMQRGLAGEVLTNLEWRLVTRSGQTRWVSQSWSPIQRHGETDLVISIIHDITQRRLAEEQLRQSHAQLEKAYQLQQEFLNGITHEIRTPMTAVKGYAEMLLDEVVGPLNSEQRKLLGKIVSAADSLLELVGSLLEAARVRTGNIELHPKACKPGDMVSKAISLVMPEAIRKGLRIDFKIDGRDRLGFYDEEKTAIVINNILGNAVKFTSQGSVEIQVESSEKGFDMVIIDTGPGIAARDLPVIFDPFRQLASSNSSSRHKAPGFGLGLSIVHGLIEILGGTLVVSSRRRIGTAFTLHIPTLDHVNNAAGDTIGAVST
ncbi:MAG: PAS domain S-box protein [Armatimonadota bacterium]|nr:PAS domain S-box protein [Armatimonadota bacterium]